MSETTILWIIGGQSAVILVLAGWFWSHVSSCNVWRNKLLQEHGELQASVRILMQQRFSER